MTDLHFLPAQQSTNVPLSFESCIIRLTGEDSADATQIMRPACAILPKPMSINSDAIYICLPLYEILNLLSDLFDEILHRKNSGSDLDIIGLAACSIYLTVDLLNKEIHLLTDCLFVS